MPHLYCARSRSGAPLSFASAIIPGALSESGARRAPSSMGAAPGRPRARSRAPADRLARSLAKIRAMASRHAAALNTSHRQNDARRPSGARAPRRRRTRAFGPSRVRDETRDGLESALSQRPRPRVAVQRHWGGRGRGSAPKMRLVDGLGPSASRIAGPGARARARSVEQAIPPARARGRGGPASPDLAKI